MKSTTRTHEGPGSDCARYVIRLEGHLDARRWHDFDGLTVSWLPDGETLLAGHVADQAALHGILTRIGDMGLTLLEVKKEAS